MQTRKTDIYLITRDLREALAGFGRNLYCGLRLALLRRCPLHEFEASWRALWLAIFILAASSIAAHFPYIAPPRLFDLRGFSTFFAIVACPLFAATIAAALFRDYGQVLRLTVAAIYILMPVWFCRLAFYIILAPWIQAHSLWDDAATLFQLWLFLAMLRLATQALPPHPFRLLAAALLLFAGLHIPMNYFNASFWYHDYETEESAAKKTKKPLDKISHEQLLNNQPALLQKQLDAMNFTPGNKPALYGVVFGSNAHQDVFMKEVKFVGDVFDKQLHMHKRFVSMINNAQTVMETPLATATNLGRALRHIGRHMRKDKDVLLLYLTSHGSAKEGLDVSLGYGLRLEYVTADRLAALLKDSGIKNRIIIISACYSGAMIAALENQDSLIMTASAKDRMSYGCSQDSELTYFADAYFKQAFPQSHDFIAAFYKARDLIRKRENNENLTHADPQIFIGGKIRGLLEAEFGMRGSAK